MTRRYAGKSKSSRYVKSGMINHVNKGAEGKVQSAVAGIYMQSFRIHSLVEVVVPLCVLSSGLCPSLFALRSSMFCFPPMVRNSHAVGSSEVVMETGVRGRAQARMMR